MIVVRRWITQKNIRLHPRWNKVTRKWVGYFLFGFIPLYIEQVSVERS
jgi:hypothetical protein